MLGFSSPPNCDEQNYTDDEDFVQGTAVAIGSGGVPTLPILRWADEDGNDWKKGIWSNMY